MLGVFQFDWRDAYRSLRATPGVTAIAVLSLALGIGANTALFSILDTLVLKPLPVREPARLTLLDRGSWTNPIWEQIRARQDELFDGAFAWSADRFDLSDHGLSDLVDGVYASGRFFEILGVPAVRGRTFTQADDVRGGGPDGAVAVISYGLWQRRFGGAKDIIGQRLSIQRVPFTVIGVTPAAFFGPDVGRACDVMIPVSADTFIRGKESFLDGRSTWWLEIMVRMKRGQTVEQATAALRGVQPQIRDATLPDGRPSNQQQYLTDRQFTLLPAATGRSPLRTRYQQPLTAIMVVVGAVLLIACANIANLLLARATARRHELSVRLALGASRFRVARQLLAESLMLATAGAALGFAFAQWGSRLLVRQLATPTNPVFLDLSIDMRVLVFTTGVALLTVILFGLAPAFGLAHVAPSDALKEQGRSVTGDRRFGLRSFLVVTQVGLSLMLVVAAGLFVRTFSSLMTVPLGFDPDPLMIVALNVQKSQTAPEQRAVLFEQLRETAASVPGVASAVTSLITPVSGQGWNQRVAVADAPEMSDRDRIVWVNGVSPAWFATYGMRIVSGRDFNSGDRAAGERVIIVNEAFTRRFFRDRNPLGREVSRIQSQSTRVIGVVSDAAYMSARAGLTPTVYVPLAQVERFWPNAFLTLKAGPGARASLERSLADALGRVDGGTAFTFRSYSAQVRASVARERLAAMLSGFFGGLALLLAGLGLYGVTSYSVNRRRTEIGVRMALGANAAGVVSLVLRRVAWLVATGVLIGAGLSFWAAQFVASLLFQLESRDPVTFVAAAVALVTVGVVAGWLPARRASRFDPARILRSS